MQQLFAAFGIDWRLLIIQGINFGVLLAAPTYFRYKPMMKMIDARREKIAEGVSAGEAAQRTLAEAQEEREGIVGNAAREAESMVASARTHADERGLQIIHTAEARADALMKDAAARAEESKRQALAEGEREIARTAMLAAEKILSAKNA